MFCFRILFLLSLNAATTILETSKSKESLSDFLKLGGYWLQNGNEHNHIKWILQERA